MSLSLAAIAVGHGQVVEEFYPAAGPPRFGEQPLIDGDLVVWKRYGEAKIGFDPRDEIQCQDMRFTDNPVISLVEYPAFRSGLQIGGGYLFRGAGNGFPGGSPVLARKIGPDCEVAGEDVVVSEFGQAIAVSREYVFLKSESFKAKPSRNMIFGKLLATLDEESAADLIPITEIKRQTNLSRTEAASDYYFVWQDCDSEDLRDTWKIHVLDISEGIGREPVKVIDSRLSLRRASSGVYLDIHDKYLVFQGGFRSTEDSERGIFVCDVESIEEPTAVATTSDLAVNLTWPSISSDYIVWTRKVDFLQRDAFAMRLSEGTPIGEAFSIGGGGNWLVINGNITVANGSTLPIDRQPPQNAIVVRELDLPGSRDVGDVDSNGRVQISDAVAILRYLITGDQRPRLRLADANHNGSIEISDALVILRYIFLSGPRP